MRSLCCSVAREGIEDGSSQKDLALADDQREIT